MSHDPTSAEPGRILIVRLSAIGDCLHTLPVLCALRRHFPQAHIAWAVEGRTGTLLEGHPDLNELIQLPRGWLKDRSKVGELRRTLRERRFDVTIDVQSLTRSAIVGWLSGASRRIGFGGWRRHELSPWLNNILVRPRRDHIIDQNLELLRPLGIHQPAVEFRLADYAEAIVSIDQFLPTQGLGSIGEKWFAIINPGGGWPSKIWPPERYAAVARHLGRESGLPSVVVWAGDKERAAAETIVSLAEGHAAVAPTTTLRELAELCRRACLFVGADSGPLHLAVAVGTPCVGILGPMPAKRNGPYGPQHESVEGTAPWRFFGLHKRSMRSILSVTSDAVAAACRSVLAQSPHPTQHSDAA
jgi:heptosyltransferase-1